MCVSTTCSMRSIHVLALAPFLPRSNVQTKKNSTMDLVALPLIEYLTLRDALRLGATDRMLRSIVHATTMEWIARCKCRCQWVRGRRLESYVPLARPLPFLTFSNATSVPRGWYMYHPRIPDKPSSTSWSTICAASACARVKRLHVHRRDGSSSCAAPVAAIQPTSRRCAGATRRAAFYEGASPTWTAHFASNPSLVAAEIARISTGCTRSRVLLDRPALPTKPHA